MTVDDLDELGLETLWGLGGALARVCGVDGVLKLGDEIAVQAVAGHVAPDLAEVLESGHGTGYQVGDTEKAGDLDQADVSVEGVLLRVGGDGSLHVDIQGWRRFG